MRYIKYTILLLLCFCFLWGDVQINTGASDVSLSGGSSLTGLVASYSLDESSLTLGDDLFPNGDMSVDNTAYWTTQYRGALTWNAGTLDCTMLANITQTNTMGVLKADFATAGKTYRIKFRAKSSNITTITLSGHIGNSTSDYATTTAILNPNLTSSYQDYEFISTCPDVLHNGLYIATEFFSLTNGVTEFTIDDISVREIDGAVSDLSGNGNNGQIANTPAVFSTDQNGVANQAMVLNGSSSNKITLNSDIAIDMDDGTISFWYKRAHLASEIDNREIIIGNTAISTGKYIIFEENTKITIEVDDGNVVAWINCVDDLLWHNYTFVGSGSNTIDLYIDGVKQTVNTNILVGTNTITLNIISRQYITYLYGSLSDLKIYNVAWTADQILNEYNAGRHTSKMKLGGDLPTMVFTADGTDDDFAGIIRGNSGDYVVFNWGDGTDTKYDLLGTGTNVAVSHTYSSYDDYTITIYNPLNLTYLDVHGQTNLGGDVSSWSALTNLTYLYCYSTSVSGDVSSWSALTNLTYLYCFSTSVSGDVSSWSALTNLTALYCSSTSVSGDVSSWSALTNLTYLNCYSTSVSGDVSSWSALTNLTALSCSSTSVSGDVSSWSALTNLTYLNCYSTSVSGDVSSWSALTNLTYLNCSSTSVEGDVSSWSALTNLTYLYCSSTSVTYTTTTLPDWDACSIQVQDCGWDSTMVDAFLCDLNASSTASTKSLNISGTNAAPTATGLACETDLEDNKGWTVTVTGE